MRPTDKYVCIIVLKIEEQQQNLWNISRFFLEILKIIL